MATPEKKVLRLVPSACAPTAMASATKTKSNIGTHTAHLWSSGRLLASATFANETASGWQEVLFSQPVQITAGTTYVASYHCNQDYSEADGYFATALTKGALTAPVNAGVYAYSTNAVFPTNVFESANFWVDVLFAAAQAQQPPAITSPLTASGTVGAAFSYQITATNNPTSFNATGLPAGLSVNTTTGLISGTPTAPGSFSVALSATNSAGTGSATLALSTAQQQAPAITSSLTANGTIGVPFTYQITATNNPTSYNASGLPGGLSVNPTTGVISGTPTAGGSFSVTISGSNAAGAGSATLALTIAQAQQPPPAITSPLTASGTVGVAFSYQITATNNPTSFTATGLPPGLSVNTTTGVISGIPTKPGGFTVTLSATNTAGTGSANLGLKIAKK